MTLYLSRSQVLRLHELAIEAFGGTLGLRDMGALDAAVSRPQMTFGGEDLYPDLAAKAGALLHSLVANHPFLDGNKRTGAAASELFLAANGLDLAASDEELEELVLAVARGELAAEALAIWIRQRLVER
ncbi:MAG TPA: type II toxin-antitoxin system death-on-curing family toxin [Thermoanaerobaculia bacterium]|nr:type II toxin-antitoxin system death-on-curing family toxin [Thermoanaerobaculia bacterium]